MNEINENERKGLIILGNGFDLACGYKTRFEDFYNEVMKTNGEFKDHNFFIQLLRETFYSDESEAKEMKEFLKINSKENWMDVELLLNHFLLGNLYEQAKECFERVAHKITNEYSPLYPRFAFHNWISMCSFDFAKGFDYYLMSQLRAFEGKLCIYLRNEAMVSGYDESKINFIFLQLTQDLSEGKVINFNYTNPWAIKEKFPVCFVHGSVYDQTAIIGIDPTINGKSVLDIGSKNKFTKTFRKIGFGCSESKIEKVLEKGISKIIFYGHSLGEQDYSYFQSIFDFYDLYSSDIVLRFCYSEHDKDRKEKDILIERIYKLINLYGKTLDNKEHGKNLLHKLLLENRVELKEIFMPEQIIDKMKNG